ncbi:Dehydratase aurZ [Colletotrichum sp. SAR 10_70]|nr:Dehydratase aurZ [Colletotrichum sp. SAR 10_71]KAI8157464.1 Dehydratase aurZ [Colletotrichum sp. SAR 10_70]KAI8216472.1 Dehydratase aurZ [Colletotrichum sp. SAR 10_77]KAI8218693.1 Dehydratase aurZ [Colletotrichum sp. SAR 10_86]KAJ4998669.1 Dehydratase aurZ [Colletotrichum sp. SAR 10_66]
MSTCITNMSGQTATETPQNTVCSIAFLKRKADLTQEEFYHHWENVHGPLVRPWAEKHGFISYTQVHAAQGMNKEATPIGPESRDANSLEGFDGCAVFELPSFEVFAAAFKDDYYLNVIEPDEKNFIDKKAGVMRSRGDMRKIL